MTHEFQILEDAVITALTPLKASLGVKTLEPMQDLSTVDDLNALARRTPAIFVAADDLTSQVHNRDDIISLAVNILVCDRGARYEAASRGATGVGPGVYVLLGAIKNALHEKRLIAGWRPLSRVREGALDVDPAKGLAIFAAQYETGLVERRF
ncbi:MAG: phage protein Gp37 [Pseudomonadota bacterium]